MSNVATDDSGASVFLYSTIPIVDSSNTRGPSITLDPPMNTSVSTIQYFRCSQTVVRQWAVVDAKSRQLLAVEPEITKTKSAWAPYAEPGETTGNFLIDSVGRQITLLKSSTFLTTLSSGEWSTASCRHLIFASTHTAPPTWCLLPTCACPISLRIISSYKPQQVSDPSFKSAVRNRECAFQCDTA
jgi:hypothetical protein